jgi:DNA gyrase subunit A
MDRFELTAEQSQAILDMRLQRLTNMERSKILEELDEMLQRIEYLKKVINDPEVLKGVIQEELREVKSKYATSRLTEILSENPQEIDVEDLIPDEDVLITLTRNGYIKRTPLTSYGKQRRGGKGMTGGTVSKTDLVQSLITASNHQNLLLFTNLGRMFRLKVYQIPESSRKAKGTHISNLVEMQKNEFVATALEQRTPRPDNDYVFISRNGMVKRTEVESYKNLRSNGLIAVSLKQGDELIAVHEVTPSSELILSTKKGYAIRFSCMDVRRMGRNALGVKGIELREGDQVVSGVVVDTSPEQTYLLNVTENGFGKRTAVSNYRLQARGGKGVITMKPTKKTGDVLGSIQVKENDQIIMLTTANKMIRFDVADIRICSRSAQGVKLIKMENGNQIVCFDTINDE